VLDEFGGTAGIVTMEILVEQLVGDISDEYDMPEPTPTAPHGEQLLDGRTTLDEFADETGYTLPEGRYDTLAGYFIAHTGRVPELDDAIRVDLPRVEDDQLAEVELRVAELDGHRASWIALRPLSTHQAAGGEEAESRLTTTEQSPAVSSRRDQGDIMGTDDKMANKTDELAGKAKETVGDATDNPDLQAEGQADQSKSNLKQAGEKVKDAFKG